MSEQASQGGGAQRLPQDRGAARPRAARAVLAASCALCLGAAQQDSCGDTTVFPPGIPLEPSANVLSSGSVRLSWREAARADSYVITLAAETGDLQHAESKTTSATVLGLQAGTRYRAQVAAVNASGTSAAADVRFVTAPAAPGALTATATLRGVHLAWTSARGVTGYRLSRWLEGSGGLPVEIGSTVATTYDDIGCDRGLKLRYRVESIPQAPDAKGPEAVELCGTPRELCVADVSGSTVRTLGTAPGPPLRTLPAATGLIAPNALAVDALHDEWVVEDQVASGALGTFRRLVFFPGGAGAATPPLRSVGGAAHPFDAGPFLWALDPARSRVIVDVYSQRWVVDRLGLVAPALVPSAVLAPEALASDPVSGLLAAYDGASRTVTVEDLANVGPDPQPPRAHFSFDPDTSYPAIALDGAAGELLLGQRVSGLPQVATLAFNPPQSGSALRAVRESPEGQIALDPARAESWSARSTSSRSAWARSADGADGALRVLAGPSTGIGGRGLAVDSRRGRLLSTSEGAAVLVHAVTADGDTAPLGRFGAPVGAPYGEVLAIDRLRDELYIAGPGAVAVWRRTAGPGEQPLRAFRPGGGPVRSMVFDPQTGELVLLGLRQTSAGDSLTLTRWPRTAGDAAGTGAPASVTQVSPGFLAVSLALIDGELWAAGSGLARLAVIGGDGNLVRRLDGVNTGLTSPIRVTSGETGELLVLEQGGRVTVLPSAAAGDAAPSLRLVTDPQARDLAYDKRASELFVSAGARVLAYGRSAAGFTLRAQLDLGSPAAVAAGLLVCH